MASPKMNILDFSQPRIRLLHLSWVAFFITFVVWFSHAPLLSHIKEAFDLSSQQVKALLILNVALTIPARMIIGMLVDRFGPRIIYSFLLIVSSFICLAFAMAQTYEQLAIARFLLGFVGAGFVIGIRLVGEWFSARDIGLAEGIYGGWGNFGSAAAAMTLPTLAYLYGGDDGWRYAIASTGALAFVYGLIFLWRAKDTPSGSEYFRPLKSGGLEVSSRKDLYFYLAMNIPMYAALMVLIWKLSPGNIALLSETATIALYVLVFLMGAFQIHQIFKVNKDRITKPIPDIDQYKFKQVAVLDVAYLVTFGSELAVVSMLPLFFMETFSLDPIKAGLLASGFAFMNLAARPGGGWLSDKFGRKTLLTILLIGLTVGYLTMSQISSGWPIALAVIATMCCSFFVQAGEGAVFAMVPLIKRRLTGQIAGMVGAYGNVGAVIFLTLLTFVSASTFFMIIAGFAAVTILLVQFMDEPEGHIAEQKSDGTVELIKVS